jgi:hypothetical protein
VVYLRTKNNIETTSGKLKSVGGLETSGSDVTDSSRHVHPVQIDWNAVGADGLFGHLPNDTYYLIGRSAGGGYRGLRFSLAAAANFTLEFLYNAVNQFSLWCSGGNAFKIRAFGTDVIDLAARKFPVNWGCDAGITVDGADLDTYGNVAYRLGIEAVTMQAGGYVDCVAGDVGKVVTDDVTPIGVLYSYNNTTRVWSVRTYDGAVVANGSVVAITGGTGAGTSTGTGTLAPVKFQTGKPSCGTAKLGAGGSVTVYLDDLGTGAGNALFSKPPVIVASYRDRSGAGILPLDVTLAADLKSAVISGDNNAPVGYIIMGEV